MFLAETYNRLLGRGIAGPRVASVGGRRKQVPFWANAEVLEVFERGWAPPCVSFSTDKVQSVAHIPEMALGRQHAIETGTLCSVDERVFVNDGIRVHEFTLVTVTFHSDRMSW